MSDCQILKLVTALQTLSIGMTGKWDRTVSDETVYDIKLQNFLHDMRFRKDLMHSDRWSLCYDFLKENYPEATGTIVTGLAYLLED